MIPERFNKVKDAWTFYLTAAILACKEDFNKFEIEDLTDPNDEDSEKCLDFILDNLYQYSPEFCNIVRENKALRERPEFHPEANAFIHIAKVWVKACWLAYYEYVMANNHGRDPKEKVLALIIVALCHDMFKMRTLKYHPVHGYPQCPGHEAAAAKWYKEVLEKSLDFSDSFNETVHWLILNHMRIKQIDQMRKSKQDALREHPDFYLLEIFNSMDSMLKPFSIQEAYNKLNRIQVD